jgi:peptidoglycan/LPS O-acetylase OafA/YrhL
VRRDIQCLRGIAVLLVVAYHAGFGFSRGFLGVDVFFVISGFLITGMVTRDIDAGRFTFGQFYWRRAKRLIPALYVTLLLTSVASVLLLTRRVLDDYLRQAAGAVLFSANLVLWGQSNYFGQSADFKPLLHTWSLSLEEQFYFLLPVSLWLTPARYRKSAIALVAAASVALCFWLSVRRPSAAFYLLPPRAWELLLGALAAVWVSASPAASSAFRSVVAYSAVASLLVLSNSSVDSVHPRVDALLVSLASVTAVWARPRFLSEGRIAGALSRAGDVSYSLYLVHWPLFTFARNVYLDGPPLGIRVLLALASFGLAELLYRKVENPIRHADIRFSPRSLFTLAAVTGVILAVPAARLLLDRTPTDWRALRTANVGLDVTCDQEGRFSPHPECQTSANPGLMIWGDSLAMHLVPGIVATAGDLGVLQATRSACGPALGIAPVVEGLGESAARACVDFNDDVVRFMAAQGALRYAVLSAKIDLYDPGRSIVTTQGATSSSTAVALAGFTRSVQALRAANKKVVIVSPPPNTDTDIGLCLERAQAGLLVRVQWLEVDCSIDALVYRERRRTDIDLLNRVSQSADVDVVWLSGLTCDQGNCATLHESFPLYRDGIHLSVPGSVWLARERHLLARILNSAR